GNPQQDLRDKGVINSGCSRYMIGNKSYLTEYEEIDGGFLAFGGNSKGGKITGKDFKLSDESHVLLKVPRKDNMYSVDLKNVVLQGGLTCLFVKATSDESNLWHRRLGHVNFKTINKLVKENLVRGIENLIDLRVKVIRCENETEFKNKVMNQFCEMKGIKREFNVSRTPQQNGVAKRKNKILIEAAKIMLADLKLPTIFWAEAVCENTLNIAGSEPNWLFNIDALTKSMNYKPIVAGNQSNGSVGTKACDNVAKTRVEIVPDKNYILIPLWTQDLPFSSSSKDSSGLGYHHHHSP
nr:hypothetical protein [Tanacetum cinerariifolium]